MASSHDIFVSFIQNDGVPWMCLMFMLLCMFEIRLFRYSSFWMVDMYWFRIFRSLAYFSNSASGVGADNHDWFVISSWCIFCGFGERLIRVFARMSSLFL